MNPPPTSLPTFKNLQDLEKEKAAKNEETQVWKIFLLSNKEKTEKCEY